VPRDHDQPEGGTRLDQPGLVAREDYWPPATHDRMRAAIDAARTEAGLATAQGGTDDRLGR
jgi:hypothetical protein